MLHLFRFVRAANAHNDPGSDGLKVFNIGYLAGIAGLLLAWNTAILIKVTVSDQYLRYTAICLKKTMDSKLFFPIIIILVVVSLCVIFSLIITKRIYIYLSKLQECYLRNLPAKNALTYIDTLVLFSILSGSMMIRAFVASLWSLNILSFEDMDFVNCIISLIVDNIGVDFIFPIYIIVKTKRYLPKLWDDSRQLIGENNDFFSINPATVAPGPQTTNQERAETDF